MCFLEYNVRVANQHFGRLRGYQYTEHCFRGGGGGGGGGAVVYLCTYPLGKVFAFHIFLVGMMILSYLPNG